MTTTDDLNALLTIRDGDVFRPDFGDGDSWDPASQLDYHVPEILTEEPHP